MSVQAPKEALSDGPAGRFLFTSECAFEGHPDKLADQIADAILDECLNQDPESKVAVEVCVHKGMVMLLGEMSTQAKVNFEELVRETCRSAGYASQESGLDCDSLQVFNKIETQSPDVAQAVHGHFTKAVDELGAGDSGVMCGYATNETPELMPVTQLLAARLARQVSQIRRSGVLPWLRSDGRAQVTVEYQKDDANAEQQTSSSTGELQPVRLHTVTLRVQHSQDVDVTTVHSKLMEHVVLQVLPPHLVDGNTLIQVNPAGRFVEGGPEIRAGVSGRRLSDDTYGGWGAHGGGSISGKDSSKVDRTGAYAARWVAASLVDSGLCARCLVQLSYAISLLQPVSLCIDSYGSARPGLSDDDLCQIVSRSFDLRPGTIIEELELQEPRFQALATFGQFGRRLELGDAGCAWEVPRKLSAS